MVNKILSNCLIASMLMLTLPQPTESQNAVGDRLNARRGGTRSVVRAMNGMVATSQPLASAAGLRVLQQGGNAIDAAIAAAAVLCVVEPMMVSPGGDLFAMIWDAKKKELKALNASGRAPKALSLDELKKRGITTKPEYGIHTVTVPGAVDGWATLLKSHGTMTLANVLQPAIEYAERGFPVTRNHRHRLARRRAAQRQQRFRRDVFAERQTAGRRRNFHEQKPRQLAQVNCQRRTRCDVQRRTR